MTLTETAAFTKRFLFFFIVFIFLLLSSWLGYRYYYYNIYLPSLPVPVEQPAAEFGRLPKLSLENTASVATISASLTYKLDTETGSVPQNLPYLMRVYFIPQMSATLLAPDRAKKLAANFDFTDTPFIVSPTMYEFPGKNGGKMRVDLNTGNFSYTRPVATESATITNLELDDQTTMASNFREFLQQKGLLTQQLVDGKSSVSYEKGTPKSSRHAVVSLWQKDIENFPIVTPKFDEGLIKATVTKYYEENSKYVNLDYTYWPIDLTKSSTYPIITADEAYERLQSNNGYIIRVTGKSPISIVSVYLAYLLPEEYSPYLQPVYVFQGDNFVGYVPAVSDEFIAKD